MGTNADLMERLAVEQSRRSFWAYRQYMRPKMKKGWWQREIAKELQQFYDDLIAGKRPKLVIQAPPQHGKSEQVTDFIAWLSGKHPDFRTIYASFSERLGVRANLSIQRASSSEKYQKIFPAMFEADGSGSTRNRELIEFPGHDGYFRNTTVRGSVTGESLDLGVVDDPIKGREEAGSMTVRDKTWDWLLDDFFTRFSEEAGLLCILTRWHVDDPIGRLIANMEGVKVLSYPAIATIDDEHRKAGDPLFPEHKSLEFLLERKKVMASPNWEALYQQNPQVLGGEIIKGAWFGEYGVPPSMQYCKIFADTAQKTGERNDYSVFQCWGYGFDNKIYLLDQIRGKWEAPELKRRAIAFWEKCIAIDRYGKCRQMVVEDKASGTGLIQEIKADGGIPIAPIQRTVDKLTRVMDVLGYIEGGNVLIPSYSNFTKEFVSECESFTADDSHMHDDQIDPMCDAITDMLVRKPMRISQAALQKI